MARFAPSTGCPRSGGSSGFIGAWRLRLDLAIDVLSSEPIVTHPGCVQQSIALVNKG
jgi:hypothetical protein